MRSMTGHGRAEHRSGAARVAVEVGSVNRRGLELSLSAPRELGDLEAAVREEVAARVSRGRVSVALACEWREGGTSGSLVDERLARAYLRELRALRTRLRLPGEITLETIARAPGVLRPASAAPMPRAVWDMVRPALRGALDAMVAMREREGAHLAADLGRRAAFLRRKVERIEAMHPGALRRQRDALRRRVRDAGVAMANDDERLAREIALLAERADVSEELTRLRSHLEQLAGALEKRGPVGRTLEFLVQEMQREFHTLGAKAPDARISQIAIACRAELERIREQVSNVE